MFHAMKLALVLYIAVSSKAILPLTSKDDEHFITYRLYENSGLYGTASYSGHTTMSNLSLAGRVDALDSNNTSESICFMSGELEGTVTFLQDGWYTFDCTFRNTATGWVWLDGHVVCGDNNAYKPAVLDNPMRIQTSYKDSFPFRAQIMANDTAHCKPVTSSVIDVLVAPNLQVSCRRESFQSSDVVPVLFGSNSTKHSTKRFNKPDQQDDVLLFHPKLSDPEQKREDLQRRLKIGWGYWLRRSILSIVKLPEGLVISFRICYSNKRSPYTTIPWLQDTTIEEENCLDAAVPDDQGTIRVDLHAYDRSYISYNVTYAGMQLQMECSVTGEQQQELQYLITVHENNNSVIQLSVVPRYAWFRPGTAVSIPRGISFQTPGMERVNFTVVEQYTLLSNDWSHFDSRYLRRSINHETDRAAVMTIPLIGAGHKVGFVAGFNDTAQVPTSVEEIEDHIAQKRRNEKHRIQHRFGGKALVAEAIQAAVMWTMIYNPIENGPFMPVSRSSNWDNSRKTMAVTPDWYYVIFDWDNLFASLLAGLDNRDIAYSNLFQVVKSKTAAGFIPNWSTGGMKSQDRTEPPVGARVLLDLYEKYKDDWIVEALWDDLYDWNNWFMDNRVIESVGLIALGSHYDSHAPGKKLPFNTETMQNARWESGLDNSPMYDGEFYDSKTYLMNMIDVGMSSLVAQEAFSLAKLADAVGKDPQIGEELRRRGDSLVQAILLQCWDQMRQTFANRYHLETNHSFVQHVTPTSFYPFLFSNTPTWSLHIQQPEPNVIESVMKNWLLNSSRFCVSYNGDFEGNDPDHCYWGLPSVSADDPTYMSTGFVYWRGYTWGPMSQIVYWSLQGGSNDDKGIVHRARKALCRQMEAMMMRQWDLNRHICENYGPYKNAEECSGTFYYHWGALNGLISMVENGYW